MSRLFEATQRARGLGVEAEPATWSPGEPSATANATELFPREQTPELPVPSKVRQAPEVRQVPEVRRAPEMRLPMHRPAPAPASADLEKLVRPGAWPPSVSEYRRLAAAVVRAGQEQSPTTVMVTSAAPGEGKTLTAANLALTIADAYGCRVLLVDADMRRPALHLLFGVGHETGLSDCLKARRAGPERVRADPAAAHADARRPAGTRSGGLLTSRNIRRLIDSLAPRFDCVVFDTPPAVLVPDAGVLSAVIQMTLMVVDSGKTTYVKAQKVVEAIGRDRIVGVVLNRTKAGVVPENEYWQYNKTPRGGARIEGRLMCGIAGVVNLDGAPADEVLLGGMIALLRHRGPDGSVVRALGPAGLAHARLSIIDLVGGTQPLSNEDGSLWITFNGEIYNYLELRETSN